MHHLFRPPLQAKPRSWICSLPNAIPPQGVNPKTSLKIRYPGDLRHRDCPKIDIPHFCHGLTPAKTRTTIRKVLKPHIREPMCNQKHISAINPHKRTRKRGHQNAITSHRLPLPRHPCAVPWAACPETRTGHPISSHGSEKEIPWSASIDPTVAS